MSSVRILRNSRLKGLIAKPDLAEAVNSQMLAMLSGLTPGSTTQNLFSTQTDATSTYVRNASLFCAGLDLTCIPAYGSGSARQFTGVAVSPQHVIQNFHAGSGNLRFVAANGTVTEIATSDRRVIGINGEIFTGSGDTAILDGTNTDIAIYKLASTLPAGVTFAKVPPSNFADWFTTLPNVFSDSNADPNPPFIPVLHVDQDKVAYVHGLLSLFNTQYPVGAFRATYIKQNVGGLSAVYQPFWQAVRNGDSGSPLFIVIDNVPVLLGTHVGTTSAPSITHWHDAINSAMTAMGGSYQLTDFSSSYQSYAA